MNDTLQKLFALATQARGQLKDEWSFLVQSPKYVGAAIVALSLGGLAGIWPGKTVFEYTWKDYRFCDDCHVHDYANEAYEASVHFGLTTCHDCHRVPIRHYPMNLFLTVFKPPQGPEDIHIPEVESVVCEQCHSEESHDELTGPMKDDVRAHIVKVDNSPLHRTHMGSETRDPGEYRGGGHGDEHAEDHSGGGGIGGIEHAPASWNAGVINCADCHGSKSNRAHRFEASRENCLACHEDLAMGSERFADVSCQECHFWGFAAQPGSMTNHDTPKNQGEAPHH